MPFVRSDEMLAGDPLPGWSGRSLHSATVTFAHYDIAGHEQVLSPRSVRPPGPRRAITRYGPTCLV